MRKSVTWYISGPTITGEVKGLGHNNTAIDTLNLATQKDIPIRNAYEIVISSKRKFRSDQDKNYFWKKLTYEKRMIIYNQYEDPQMTVRDSLGLYFATAAHMLASAVLRTKAPKPIKVFFAQSAAITTYWLLTQQDDDKNDWDDEGEEE